MPHAYTIEAIETLHLVSADNEVTIVQLYYFVLLSQLCIDGGDITVKYQCK